MLQSTDLLPFDGYPDLIQSLNAMPAAEAIGHCRWLCRTDLYFLLRYGFNRADVEHKWLFDRCREVQEAPNEHLDLWARDHYKSTIITVTQTLQDILRTHGEGSDKSEITVGIFSHTRPIAKKFLQQIKRECEQNEKLKSWFPDVLWQKPDAESPKWSEDGGLIFRRESNPKEATIEAWGLVDGQPTGSHFRLMVYDDVVTRESVTTPDMIKKTTEALELSYNLSAPNGVRRFIGTRYHANDSYSVIIKRGTATKRIYPATDNGQLDGKAVFLSQENYLKKVRDMGTYTASCQLLQNPLADTTQGFKREWLRFYQTIGDGAHLNRYLICDPAGEKNRKGDNDYTAMAVIGLGPDQKYYVMDMVYDRLNLAQRTAALFALHRRWKPNCTGYEKYGKDSDIEHIKGEMERNNYRFDIVELGGRVAKNDRIRGLVPLFEQTRFYLPESLIKTRTDNKTVDLVEIFLTEEYDPFPVGVHDDMFDCLARIRESALNTSFPIGQLPPNDRYARAEARSSRGGSWMSR